MSDAHSSKDGVLARSLIDAMGMDVIRLMPRATIPEPLFLSGSRESRRLQQCHAFHEFM